MPPRIRGDGAAKLWLDPPELEEIYGFNANERRATLTIVAFSVPLSWFPRLEAADEEQLRNWELIGPGWGIHWPSIDEHVSVVSLLRPEDTIPSREIREREAARGR